jgi:hypothetical protein
VWVLKIGSVLKNIMYGIQRRAIAVTARSVTRYSVKNILISFKLKTMQEVMTKRTDKNVSSYWRSKY